MTAHPHRPIRVVLFGGPYLDPPATRFVLALEADPRIELVGVLCQAPAAGLGHRWRELWRRRGLFAFGVLLRDALSAAGRWLASPRRAREGRRLARALAPRRFTVPDVHAPEVLRMVRDWRPDLGAVYGGPILRPELFRIPQSGTLGIHHGRVPEYRGRKTTFWEIYNGEKVAGVTIQRINAGIDTGDVVKAGTVVIGCKGYGRVERETQDLGLRLFVEAILEARSNPMPGTPQPAVKGRHYGQPSGADLLRLWLRILRRRLGARST